MHLSLSVYTRIMVASLLWSPYFIPSSCCFSLYSSMGDPFQFSFEMFWIHFPYFFGMVEKWDPVSGPQRPLRPPERSGTTGILWDLENLRIKIKNISQIFLKVISLEHPLWSVRLFMIVSKNNWKISMHVLIFYSCLKDQVNIKLKRSFIWSINLKNVMKVFVYFGISIAKTGVFIDIFTHCKLASRRNLLLRIIVNSWIKKRTSEK